MPLECLSKISEAIDQASILSKIENPAFVFLYRLSDGTYHASVKPPSHMSHVDYVATYVNGQERP